MRLLRLLFVALFALVSVSVYGIEPSTQIVVRNGKKVYVHKVEKGHTLYSIAKAYGVTEQQIIDSNEGLSAEKLKIDDIIYIPCIEKKGSKGNQKKNDKEDGKYYYHEVKQGDTFYSIARAYKISVNTLREDNPSVDPSSMSLGIKLRIRRGEVGYATTEEIDRTEQSDKPTSTGPNEYVVQAGDTVYSLSRRAGLTEREFMALNKLRTVNDLKVGMVVLLGSTITEEPAKQTEEQTEEQAEEQYPTEQTEEQQGEESQGDDTVGGDEQVPEEVAEEFNRERLSGRSDDNPVPDDDFTFPWFMFGDEEKLEDSFRHAEIDFMELGANNTLKVALMLPFKMVILQRLVVSDVHHDAVEDHHLRSLGGRYEHTPLEHVLEQSDSLQAYGLTSGVRSRDQEYMFLRSQSRRKWYDILLLLFECALKKRMSCFAKVHLAVIRDDRHSSYEVEGNLCLRHDEVDFSKVSC